jgi:anti-anti-sigma regulatory factor
VDMYLAGGRFDLTACIDGWSETCARTKAEGFAALRVIADMGWAATGLPGVEDVAAYEARVNTVYADGYAMAVCQYDTRIFRPGRLRTFASAHPGTLRSGDQDSGSPLLRIRRVGPARLRLIGDSDASNRAAVEAALADLGGDAERHGRPAVLDLTGLQFADSATTGALVGFAAASDTGLTIVGCHPGLREMLHLFGPAGRSGLTFSPTVPSEPAEAH